jgi:cytochrome c oxidase assembly protein subunit 15
MTPSRSEVWLHRYASLLATATFFLIIAGGLVTSTGSGLAVPDWPLSYGTFFPPMVGGIFYEHGHRLIAGTVALLTLGLALALWRYEPRRWVRGLGFAALGAVVAQAVLGGITVLLLLPTPVSVAHACLGQTFFCLTVTLALVTSRSWAEAGREARAVEPGTGLPLRTVGTIATGVVFGQLALGAWMRHSGAGLAIPTFPLAFGRIVPPLASPEIALHFSHRVGALVVSGFVAWLVARVFARHRQDAALALPAIALSLLLPLQIVLGAYTIWTAKAVAPATAHVATGALILASCLLLTLQAARRLESAAPARARSLRRAAGASQEPSPQASR